VRCARCKNVWFATAPIVVPAFAMADDFDVIDTGPKVPAFDAPPPEAEAPETEAPPLAAEAAPEAKALSAALSAEPKAPPPAPEATPEGDQAEAVPEESSDIAAPDAAMPGAAEEPQPEPASTEGINVEGLREDMEVERTEQAAAADAVLAEVAGEEVTVADAPPLVPPMEPVDAPDSQAAVPAPDAGEGIETFAACRTRRQALRHQNRQWPVPGLPTIILALVVANTILVAWRMDVVRLLPQTASLYAAVGLPVNLRGLAFDDIKMSKEEQEGMPVLVVEGSIVNVTRRAVEVPRLRLAVRNEAKNEIYSWTTLPARSILSPGETLPFRARLASPPAETRDVLVRFFTRRDIVAGLH